MTKIIKERQVVITKKYELSPIVPRNSHVKRVVKYLSQYDSKDNGAAVEVYVSDLGDTKWIKYEDGTMWVGVNAYGSSHYPAPVKFEYQQIDSEEEWVNDINQAAEKRFLWDDK